jgi:hypothetical protein
MHLWHQFECNMFMDSELDSKLNSGIPNWFGSLPCCARLLDSPALLGVPYVLIIISMVPNNN